MKDFDQWNDLKKNIHLNKNNFIPRSGEVCLCSLGINIGFESDGKNQDFIRPVLVIKSYGTSGAIVLPLTSKKQDNIFHFELNEKSFIKLTQIRFIDSRRFKRKLYRIDMIVFKSIRNHLLRVI